MIPIIIGALRTVPKSIVNRPEKFEIERRDEST